MPIIRAIVVLILIVVVGVSIVKNHSIAARSLYHCQGMISVSDGEPEPGKIYVRTEQYRWWVHPWGDDDGAAWVEFPRLLQTYVPTLHVAEAYIMFSGSEGANETGKISTLSGYAEVRVGRLDFRGQCEQTD